MDISTPGSAATVRRGANRAPRSSRTYLQTPHDPTGESAPRAGWRPTACSLAGRVVVAIGTIFTTGCGTSLVGPAATTGTPLTVPAAVQCSSDGLAAQDLAGQCRTVPTTMGALEATDVQTASATSSVLAQASSSSIRVSWSPLENGTTGYVVYFGRTADAADILVSDLPAGSGRFDPTAPAVTYDPGRDLGLHPGDTACFRISGRDSAGGLASEFTLTCTTV